MGYERIVRWGRPLAVTALIAAGGLWLTQAGAQPEEGPDPVLGPAVVEVAAVTSRNLVREERVLGVVEPRAQGRLALTLAGRLVERPVDVGDRVARGDLLARIDPRGPSNAVRAARATVGEIEAQRGQVVRDQRRARLLSEDGVATDVAVERATSSLERVEAAYRAARARLRESRRQASETLLRAPFDGVVTDVFFEEGELVEAGRPVLRIAGSDDGLEVLVEATSGMAARLAPATEVEVRPVGLDGADPAAGAVLLGRIRTVVADAVGLGGLHPVRIELPDDPALRSGLGVEVRLRAAGDRGLTVPLRAILDPSGQRPFVWRLERGRVERVWIRTGRYLDGEVEVVEGLSADDVVVVGGQGRLLDGDPVQVDAALAAGGPS
ncbi:MAG: efflux RND transporter periplasmic adaptor subunit [Sandaracinaceae bacterium]